MATLSNRIVVPAVLAAALALAACSSPSGFRADSPTDAAQVPTSNYAPADASIDNRGKGN